MSQDMNIDEAFVCKLIQHVHPEWSYLDVKQIIPGGHDHRSFRLGKEYIIRIPSASCYEAQIQKEWTWLPELMPHLSTLIPKPINIGAPTDFAPVHWAVYEWIEGVSLDQCQGKNGHDVMIARQLARFLKELHQIEGLDGPTPGTHNFHRGGSLSLYYMGTIEAIDTTLLNIDRIKARQILEKAMASTWEEQPVWVHGDIAIGNIIIHNDALHAMIDFGCMAMGDPACDLVIAWHFFEGEGRKVFQEQLPLDTATWARAKGWALWKALVAPVPGMNPEKIIRSLYEEEASCV